MFFSHLVAISYLLVLGYATAGDPDVVLLGGDSDERRRVSVHNNCWRPVWCPIDLFSCGNGIVLKRCGLGCNFPTCPVVDIDECAFDWECPIGMSCQSGSCSSNVNSCTFDWECPRGRSCRNGSCVRNRPGRPNTSMFTCANGDRIPLSQVCNGEFNCADGSDEWTTHGCLQFSTGRRLEKSEDAVEEPTAEPSDFESVVEQPVIQRRTSPAARWCTFDRDCAPGFECHFGRCEAISSFCVIDWECPVGMHCRNGSCHSNVNFCTFDWECPARMNCRSGSCSFDVDFCTFDWECPVGMNCLNGSCSNPIYCSFNWECPTGQRCGRGGTCRPRRGRDLD